MDPARASSSATDARADPTASPCAAGLCWLIQLRGDDAARRAQIEAIAALDGFTGMRAPAHAARVPRYIGWKLASGTDADQDMTALDTTAQRIAAIGAHAVIDRHL